MAKKCVGGGVQLTVNLNKRHLNVKVNKCNCTPRPPGLRVSEEGGMDGSLEPVYNCTPRPPLNRLFLRNYKTILTSVNGPMMYNILKALFIATQFRKYVNMQHEALEIKLRFVLSI